MTYNAGERKEVRRAEKEAKVAARQGHAVIKGIMDTIAGREWMHDILERCHMFATSFSNDNGVMAFAEGERNIGLQLLNGIMEACPNQYVLMMGEANERRQSGGRRDPEDGNGRDSASDFDDPDSGAGDDSGAEGRV